MELLTDRLTDEHKDERTIQLLDPPVDLAGQGHKKLMDHLQARIQEFSSGGVQPSENFWQAKKKKRQKGER